MLYNIRNIDSPFVQDIYPIDVWLYFSTTPLLHDTFVHRKINFYTLRRLDTERNGGSS